MPTVIVTQSSGHVVQVRLVAGDTTDTTIAEELAAVSGEASPTAETNTAETPKAAPNPIAPETKEIAWAAGSFIVLLVIMRYFLFPKLKKGMDDRYASVRSDSEGADRVRADAKADVAEYEKALAAVRAEAAGRVDAARQTVDNERNAQLAQVNGRIAAARADADQKNAAAREAAQGDVASAVATVASRVAEIALGKAPDASVVSAAVALAMEGSRS
jgi:F-type H+-transporting ATPase subunit b